MSSFPMIPEQLKIKAVLKLLEDHYLKKGYTTDFVEEVVTDTKNVLLSSEKRTLNTIISRESFAEELLRETRNFECKQILQTVSAQREFARCCAPDIFDRVYAGLEQFPSSQGYYKPSKLEVYAIRFVKAIIPKVR